MIRIYCSVLVATFLVVPSALSEEHDDSHHKSTLNGVNVIHAWTRATAGPVAYVFMEIENESDGAVILEGAETGIAARIDLVGFEMKNGSATYTDIPQMPIAAGRDLHLEPDGLAFRLEDLAGKLEQGSEFEMEVMFDIGHLDVHVDVEDTNAKQHSHAGHSH